MLSCSHRVLAEGLDVPVFAHCHVVERIAEQTDDQAEDDSDE